jgi:hypothetical protein
MKIQSIITPLLLAGIFCSSALQAALPGLKTTRITSRTPGDNRYFGASCAVTDRFIVIGEPGSSSNMTPAVKGAVHVYDANTGTPLRTLTPKDSTLRDCFGSKVAVRGSQALISAVPYDLGSGSVYLFDLTTGAQLQKFTAPNPVIMDDFGYSITFVDGLAAIGAVGTNTYAGRVYTFDLVTGQHIGSYENAISGSRFGHSIAAQSGTLIIGAPQLQSGKGGVYVLDLLSGTMLLRQSSALANGDMLGASVASYGHSIIASAPSDTTNQGTKSGSLYRCDLTNSFSAQGPSVLPSTSANNQSLGYLLAADNGWLVASRSPSGSASLELYHLDPSSMSVSPTFQIKTEDIDPSFYGTPVSLALSGDRLVITNYSGMGRGEAYLIQSLPTEDRGNVITQLGSYASGAGSSTFKAFVHGTMNAYNYSASIMAGLAGPDSNAGKDLGVWDQDGSLVLKSRDDLGNGLRISTIKRVMENNSHGRVMDTILSGTGVTSANNRAVFCGDSSNLVQLMRTGTPIGALGALAKISQVVDCYLADSVTSSVTLASGINGVTASNDSAIIAQNPLTGAIQTTVREGSSSPIMGINYGQMSARVAHFEDLIAYTASLFGPTTTAQGLFTVDPMMAGSQKLVARKGEPAPVTGGAVFGGFLGETVNYDKQTIFWSTLTGNGVTSTNNEGIWLNDGVSNVLIARKGSAVPHLSSMKWSRFLRAWPLDKDEVLLRATIAGLGVKAANDEGLYILKKDGSAMTILREGDFAPGCFGARISKLQAIEVSSDSYAVIAQLSGTSSTTNLAVLCGRTNSPIQQPSDRRPILLLRKGTLVTNGYGVSTRITSMSFASTQGQDASGVGAKGLADSMNDQTVLLKTTYSDGSIRMSTYQLGTN